MSYVLINGVDSELGMAIAQRLAASDHNIIVTGRDAEFLNAAGGKLEEVYGVRVVVIVFDAGAANSAQELFERVAGFDVEVVVNNFDYYLSGAHAELDARKLRALLNTNVVFCTIICGLFAEQMRHQQKRGYFMNVVPALGGWSFKDMAAYSASKGYVLNFSLAFARELADWGASVTCACPSLFVVRGGSDSALSGSSEYLRAASKAVRAMFARKKIVVLGGFVAIVVWVARILPSAAVEWVVSYVMGCENERTGHN